MLKNILNNENDNYAVVIDKNGKYCTVKTITGKVLVVYKNKLKLLNGSKINYIKNMEKKAMTRERK